MGDGVVGPAGQNALQASDNEVENVTTLVHKMVASPAQVKILKLLIVNR